MFVQLNPFCCIWFVASPYWSLGRPMRDITAHDEDNVKFECNVLGSPPPLIRWFSNGIPIEGTVINPVCLLSPKAVKNLF